ncbi:PhoD-like phosphatase N-terminal domain-containing protein, partial [Mesorhizobium sp.]
MNKLSLTRRAFVTSASAFGLVGASGLALPYYSRANQRPAFTHGVQSGDVDATSGMVWTRTDRPARVMYEVSTTESFADAVRLAPLDTSPASDYTVKRLLTDLAADQDIFYRMTAADLS